MDTPNVAIGADAAKLAGLQIDFLQKYRSGQITFGHFEWFVCLTREQRDMLSGANLTALVKKQPPLEFVSAVMVPATTENFFAKKKFVVDTSASAPVKISYISDNFTEYFLAGDGKIEDPITEQTIRVDKLCQSSRDTVIITALGGEDKAKITLTELYALMAMQPNGEKGVLLTNGYANIAYIIDQRGVLRAVDVGWSGDGWNLIARGVGCPDGRLDGSHALSRNSCRS